MNIQPLRKGAELCLSALCLTPDDAKLVRGCVNRYSMPHTFSKQLKWAGFRIANLFKSVVGRSEWQLTQKMVFTKALKIAKDQNIYQPNKNNQLNIKQNALIKKELNSLTSSLLKGCLNTHTSKTEVHLIKENLERLNIRNYIKSKFQTTKTTE